MLFCVFLLLAVWEGVIGSQSSCSGSDYPMCPTPYWSFPTDEEDVNRMCPQITLYQDCHQNYFERCGFRNDLDAENFSKLRRLEEDACRKDSPLHLGIVQNIGCFHRVFFDDKYDCSSYKRSQASLMKEHLQNDEVKERIEVSASGGNVLKSFECLKESLHLVCLATKVSERCGSDARDIAVEFLTRADIAYQHCPFASDEIIEELLSPLKLESEDEATLKRFLGKE